MSAVLGDDKEKSTAQAASDDLRGAINMGKGAAHTAKTVSKAAAQAASGNVAGAAVSILKDPETMKNLLIIILLPIIFLATVMVVFLYALPTAIFESVVSFFAHVKEAWDTAELSNEYGGGFLSTLIGATIQLSNDLPDLIGGKIQGIWNSLKNVFADDEGNDSEKNQTEAISDNGAELTITAQEASEKLAIVKKAVAINKKYDIRAQQIKVALDGDGTSIKNSSGESLNSYLKDRFCGDRTWNGLTINTYISQMGTTSDYVTNKLESLLEEMQNPGSVSELNEATEKFNDTLQLLFPAMEATGTSNINAISALSLLMVQQGGSLMNMKMSDFLRYLGWYKNNNPDNISFDVGYCADPFMASVKSWKGTFKPQYLVEETKNYQQELNALTTRIDGMKDSDEVVVAAKERIAELEDKIELYENSGMPLIDLLIQLDFIDLDNLPSPNPEEGTPCSKKDGGTTYTYISPDGKSTMFVNYYKEVHHKGAINEWTEYFCDISINCYVIPAGIDNVVYQVGLWNGSLDTVQDNTPVDDFFEVEAN